MQEEDTPDLQKKIQASFKAIATSFADSSKAEENMQKLHQMKDNNIFKSLNVLLTPTTQFKQALATRVRFSPHSRLTIRSRLQYNSSDAKSSRGPVWIDSVRACCSFCLQS